MTSKPFPFSVVVKAELVLWDGQLSFWHRIIHEEPSPFRDNTFSIMFTSPSVTKATWNRIPEYVLAVFHPKQLICLRQFPLLRQEPITWLRQFLAIVFYGDLSSFRLVRWFCDRDWVHPAIFLGCKKTLICFPLIMALEIACQTIVQLSMLLMSCLDN